MKKLRTEFVKNIGKTGDHIFKQERSGITPNGQPIYIYSRHYKDSRRLFSYEVILPYIKPAGDVKMPDGRVVNHPEDYEDYTTTSLFGIRGWELPNRELANKKFEELESGKHIKKKKIIVLPDSEFTIKDVIAKNDNLAYPNAHAHIKALIANKEVELVRQDKGKKGKINVYKTT